MKTTAGFEFDELAMEFTIGGKSVSIIKFVRDALFGPGSTTFKKGSHPVAQNPERHEVYKDDWVSAKKKSGKWLPNDEYEKKTGKPGRK